MNFKLPRNIISNNVIKNVLYLITLVLAVSYIINEQNLALITLILIACVVYAMNKGVVISLFMAIIITNLLLTMNYFENIETMTNNTNYTNNTNCCEGGAFYNSNLTTYSSISENINNKITCATIENDINANMPTDESQQARFLSILYSDYGYLKAKSICDTMDANSSILNMKGMLFKKTSTSLNVLDDPNILPKDILDMLASSNIINSLDENSKIILETNVIEKLQTMNSIIIANSRQQNLQRQINITDLTPSQITELTNIKNTLKELYSSSNTNLLKKDTMTYTLVSKTKDAVTNTYLPVTNNGTPYLLNPDQFFDCSGLVQNSNSGTLSAFDKLDLSNNDYFGTAGRPVSLGGLGDASYNPYGSVAQSELYPSNKDLEMELRRLEILPSSGNVPVNVISTYLNAINNFYEKQIQNITASKSNVFQQETINDIYSIKTKEPTFFTYTNNYNNDYKCEDSITGNSAFKYCGPSAYYEIPKF